MFTDLNVPGIAQLCEPIRAWLAEKRELQARKHEWRADYRRKLQQEDLDTYAALGEDDEPEQPDEKYQAVHAAWLALGCHDTHDDTNPANDPHKAALERAYPFNPFASQ
jgi:hypothetical protein